MHLSVVISICILLVALCYLQFQPRYTLATCCFTQLNAVHIEYRPCNIPQHTKHRPQDTRRVKIDRGIIPTYFHSPNS
ncbi:hypothetical protein GGR57DRAFT_480681 [Xylariaceae sp. FL1272]|nr:hypothetical protein GGR57DRAFT_480681 [Xylariaceae sp. FL1272]